jgi:hypothetical protein
MEATRVEIGLHVLAACLAFGIRRTAILAGEEARGQRVIGDDPDLLALAEFGEITLELRAGVEIVFRLDDIIAPDACLLRCIEGRLKLFGIEVGTADRANLALVLQPGEGGKALLVIRFRIRPMGEIEIDIVGLQAAQRILDRLRNAARTQPPALATEIGADLGDDDGILALDATALQPVADDRLAFPPPTLPSAQSEYMSAVSIVLKPASKKRSRTSNDVFSSAVQPKTLPPSTTGAIERPVRPRARFCMGSLGRGMGEGRVESMLSSVSQRHH